MVFGQAWGLDGQSEGLGGLREVTVRRPRSLWSREVCAGLALIDEKRDRRSHLYSEDRAEEVVLYPVKSHRVTSGGRGGWGAGWGRLRAGRLRAGQRRMCVRACVRLSLSAAYVLCLARARARLCFRACAVEGACPCACGGRGVAAVGG